MPDLQPKEIEIGVTGTHTAANGETVTFTREMFDEIAKNYDPSRFRAPLIISHRTFGVNDGEIANYSADDSGLPAAKHLAFGFPKTLKVVGDRLKAVFENISPRAVKLNHEGALLSISPSFYKPTSPNNPTPGKWSLRHIAMLGAEPPAMKNLAPLSLQEFEQGTPNQDWAIALDFDEDSSDSLTFNMAKPKPLDFCGNDRAIASVFRGLRDWLIDEHDIETADRVLPSYLIDMLAEPMPETYSYNEVSFMDYKKWSDASGISEARLKAIMEGAEPTEEEQMLMDEAGIKKGMKHSKKKTTDMNEGVNYSELQAELERYKQEAIEAKNQLRRKDITSFCEKMSSKEEARLTPAMLGEREVSFGETSEEIGLVDFMASLDPKQEAFMKSFISGLPKAVDFSQSVLPDSGRTPAFSSLPPGVQANPESVELDQKIRAYASEHSLSYSQAYSQMSQQGVLSL